MCILVDFDLDVLIRGWDVIIAGQNCSTNVSDNLKLCQKKEKNTMKLKR